MLESLAEAFLCKLLMLCICVRFSSVAFASIGAEGVFRRRSGGTVDRAYAHKTQSTKEKQLSYMLFLAGLSTAASKFAQFAKQHEELYEEEYPQVCAALHTLSSVCSSALCVPNSWNVC